MSENDELIRTNTLIWKLETTDKELKLDLKGLKDEVKNAFFNQSDSYKQRLVYDLLESAKNNDQHRFFYLLLRAINKPKEGFGKLCKKLEKNYDILPEQAFINFSYSIIIGIMATYSNKNKKIEEGI